MEVGVLARVAMLAGVAMEVAVLAGVVMEVAVLVRVAMEVAMLAIVAIEVAAGIIPKWDAPLGSNETCLSCHSTNEHKI